MEISHWHECIRTPPLINLPPANKSPHYLQTRNISSRHKCERDRRPTVTNMYYLSICTQGRRSLPRRLPTRHGSTGRGLRQRLGDIWHGMDAIRILRTLRLRMRMMSLFQSPTFAFPSIHTAGTHYEVLSCYKDAVPDGQRLEVGFMFTV